jgi:hypothetical protein
MGALGVAQVVECLCSKFEALSSNPSTPKRKQKQLSFNPPQFPFFSFFLIIVVLGGSAL